MEPVATGKELVICITLEFGGKLRRLLFQKWCRKKEEENALGRLYPPGTTHRTTSYLAFALQPCLTSLGHRLAETCGVCRTFIRSPLRICDGAKCLGAVPSRSSQNSAFESKSTVETGCSASRCKKTCSGSPVGIHH